MIITKTTNKIRSNQMQLQGVPRNMTVGECLLPYIVKLFDTKGNNINIIWKSCHSKINLK